MTAQIQKLAEELWIIKEERETEINNECIWNEHLSEYIKEDYIRLAKCVLERELIASLNALELLFLDVCADEDIVKNHLNKLRNQLQQLRGGE
jgi:hypothetical protein